MGAIADILGATDELQALPARQPMIADRQPMIGAPRPSAAQAGQQLNRATDPAGLLMGIKLDDVPANIRGQLEKARKTAIRSVFQQDSPKNFFGKVAEQYQRGEIDHELNSVHSFFGSLLAKQAKTGVKDPELERAYGLLRGIEEAVQFARQSDPVEGRNLVENAFVKAAQSLPLMKRQLLYEGLYTLGATALVMMLPEAAIPALLAKGGRLSRAVPFIAGTMRGVPAGGTAARFASVARLGISGAAGISAMYDDAAAEIFRRNKDAGVRDDINMTWTRPAALLYSLSEGLISPARLAGLEAGGFMSKAVERGLMRAVKPGMTRVVARFGIERVLAFLGEDLEEGIQGGTSAAASVMAANAMRDPDVAGAVFNELRQELAKPGVANLEGIPEIRSAWEAFWRKGVHDMLESAGAVAAMSSLGLPVAGLNAARDFSATRNLEALSLAQGLETEPGRFESEAGYQEGMRGELRRVATERRVEGERLRATEESARAESQRIADEAARLATDEDERNLITRGPDIIVANLTREGRKAVKDEAVKNGVNPKEATRNAKDELAQLRLVMEDKLGSPQEVETYIADTVKKHNAEVEQERAAEKQRVGGEKQERAAEKQRVEREKQETEARAWKPSRALTKPEQRILNELPTRVAEHVLMTTQEAATAAKKAKMGLPEWRVRARERYEELRGVLESTLANPDAKARAEAAAKYLSDYEASRRKTEPATPGNLPEERAKRQAAQAPEREAATIEGLRKVVATYAQEREAAGARESTVLSVRTDVTDEGALAALREVLPGKYILRSADIQNLTRRIAAYERRTAPQPQAKPTKPISPEVAAKIKELDREIAQIEAAMTPRVRSTKLEALLAQLENAQAERDALLGKAPAAVKAPTATQTTAVPAEPETEPVVNAAVPSKAARYGVVAESIYEGIKGKQGSDQVAIRDEDGRMRTMSVEQWRRHALELERKATREMTGFDTTTVDTPSQKRFEGRFGKKISRRHIQETKRILSAKESSGVTGTTLGELSLELDRMKAAGYSSREMAATANAFIDAYDSIIVANRKTAEEQSLAGRKIAGLGGVLAIMSEYRDASMAMIHELWMMRSDVIKDEALSAKANAAIAAVSEKNPSLRISSYADALEHHEGRQALWAALKGRSPLFDERGRELRHPGVIRRELRGALRDTNVRRAISEALFDVGGRRESVERRILNRIMGSEGFQRVPITKESIASELREYFKTLLIDVDEEAIQTMSGVIGDRVGESDLRAAVRDAVAAVNDPRTQAAKAEGATPLLLPIGNIRAGAIAHLISSQDIISTDDVARILDNEAKVASLTKSEKDATRNEVWRTLGEAIRPTELRTEAAQRKAEPRTSGPMTDREIAKEQEEQFIERFREAQFADEEGETQDDGEDMARYDVPPEGVQDWDRTNLYRWMSDEEFVAAMKIWESEYEAPALALAKARTARRVVLALAERTPAETLAIRSAEQGQTSARNEAWWRFNRDMASVRDRIASERVPGETSEQAPIRETDQPRSFRNRAFVRNLPAAHQDMIRRAVGVRLQRIFAVNHRLLANATLGQRAGPTETGGWIKQAQDGEVIIAKHRAILNVARQTGLSVQEVYAIVDNKMPVGTDVAPKARVDSPAGRRSAEETEVRVKKLEGDRERVKAELLEQGGGIIARFRALLDAARVSPVGNVLSRRIAARKLAVGRSPFGRMAGKQLGSAQISERVAKIEADRQEANRKAKAVNEAQDALLHALRLDGVSETITFKAPVNKYKPKDKTRVVTAKGEATLKKGAVLTEDRRPVTLTIADATELIASGKLPGRAMDASYIPAARTALSAWLRKNASTLPDFSRAAAAALADAGEMRMSLKKRSMSTKYSVGEVEGEAALSAEDKRQNTQIRERNRLRELLFMEIAESVFKDEVVHVPINLTAAERGEIIVKARKGVAPLRKQGGTKEHLRIETTTLGEAARLAVEARRAEVREAHALTVAAWMQKNEAKLSRKIKTSRADLLASAKGVNDLDVDYAPEGVTFEPAELEKRRRDRTRALISVQERPIAYKDVVDEGVPISGRADTTRIGAPEVQEDLPTSILLAIANAETAGRRVASQIAAKRRSTQSEADTGSRLLTESAEAGAARLAERLSGVRITVGNRSVSLVDAARIAAGLDAVIDGVPLRGEPAREVYERAVFKWIRDNARSAYVREATEQAIRGAARQAVDEFRLTANELLATEDELAQIDHERQIGLAAVGAEISDLFDRYADHPVLGPVIADHRRRIDNRYFFAWDRRIIEQVTRFEGVDTDGVLSQIRAEAANEGDLETVETVARLQRERRGRARFARETGSIIETVRDEVNALSNAYQSMLSPQSSTIAREEAAKILMTRTVEQRAWLANSLKLGTTLAAAAAEAQGEVSPASQIVTRFIALVRQEGRSGLTGLRESVTALRANLDLFVPPSSRVAIDAQLARAESILRDLEVDAEQDEHADERAGLEAQLRMEGLSDEQARRLFGRLTELGESPLALNQEDAARVIRLLQAPQIRASLARLGAAIREFERLSEHGALDRTQNPTIRAVMATVAAKLAQPIDMLRSELETLSTRAQRLEHSATATVPFRQNVAEVQQRREALGQARQAGAGADEVAKLEHELGIAETGGAATVGVAEGRRLQTEAVGQRISAVEQDRRVRDAGRALGATIGTVPDVGEVTAGRVTFRFTREGTNIPSSVQIDASGRAVVTINRDSATTQTIDHESLRHIGIAGLNDANLRVLARHLGIKPEGMSRLDLEEQVTLGLDRLDEGRIAVPRVRAVWQQFKRILAAVARVFGIDWNPETPLATLRDIQSGRAARATLAGTAEVQRAGVRYQGGMTFANAVKIVGMDARRQWIAAGKPGRMTDWVIAKAKEIRSAPKHGAMVDDSRTRILAGDLAKLPEKGKPGALRGFLQGFRAHIQASGTTIAKIIGPTVGLQIETDKTEAERKQNEVIDSVWQILSSSEAKSLGQGANLLDSVVVMDSNGREVTMDRNHLATWDMHVREWRLDEALEVARKGEAAYKAWLQTLPKKERADLRKLHQGILYHRVGDRNVFDPNAKIRWLMPMIRGGGVWEFTPQRILEVVAEASDASLHAFETTIARRAFDTGGVAGVREQERLTLPPEELSANPAAKLRANYVPRVREVGETSEMRQVAGAETARGVTHNRVGHDADLDRMPEFNELTFSTKPFVLYGLLELMGRHTRDVSRYVGWQEVATKWKAALHKYKHEIEFRVGPAYYSGLMQALNRAEGGLPVSTGPISRVWRKMLSLTGRVVLQNPRIWLYQVTAALIYPRFFGMNATFKAFSTRFTPDGQRVIDEIMKRSPQLRMRNELANIENIYLDETQDMNTMMHAMQLSRPGRFNRLKHWRSRGSFGMQKMLIKTDAFTIKLGLLSAYHFVKENHPDLSESEAMDRAATLGAVVVNNTQPSTNPFDMTTARASSDFLNSALTFMTGGVSAIWNTVERDMIDLHRNRDAESAKRAAYTIALTALQASAIGFIRHALTGPPKGGDEDENKWTDGLMLNMLDTVVGQYPSVQAWTPEIMYRLGTLMGSEEWKQKYGYMRELRTGRAPVRWLFNAGDGLDQVLRASRGIKTDGTRMSGRERDTIMDRGIKRMGEAALEGVSTYGLHMNVYGIGKLGQGIFRRYGI